MKIFKILITLSLTAFIFTACEKILAPENDNHSTLDRVYDEPGYAEGLLLRAFTYIPTNDYRWDEVATDDAVSNDKLNSFSRIARGEWSALFDPQSVWDNSNRAIIYIDEFLKVVDDIPWKLTNMEQNGLFIKRLKGESYALRGMFKYYLLRNHGGFSTDGQMLGTPIFNVFPETAADFGTPRSSFDECVASANADFDEALKYLPQDFGNITALSQVPAIFPEVTNVNNYNVVIGDNSRQRISGRITKAMKSRLALLAASPAFNPNNVPALWETAANQAAELITMVGGTAGLDANGRTFYVKAQVDDAKLNSGDNADIKEIIWRRPFFTDRARETTNFPPSLFGSGRTNPTQNLVDAFGMANGYPITHPSSGYNPANPYASRDSRLGLYILYNGSTFKSTTINVTTGSGDNAVDAIPTSTRTGYYLRKLLREDVNANPSSAQNQDHFNTHIRYTEIFLNYAEAANEAFGPNGTGPNAPYTARAVIRAIRGRAGIATADPYLASVTTKDAMRDLIRNERRLELCFEGFRFWDLRRWKADLTVPARGVKITGTTYNYFNVEDRAFDNTYMHYGPIPDKEVIKFNLIQNKGWN